MPKVIQMTSVAKSPVQRDECRHEQEEIRVFALCDDGSMWMISPDGYEAQWSQLPKIPDVGIY